METSIFSEKTIKPGPEDLKKALCANLKFWDHLRDVVLNIYPPAIEEWNYSGLKYGWNYRMKDKKRAIIYLLPREGFFKVGMVFGGKATDEILNSGISETIKTELRNARPYAEGRGIRIEIRDDSLLQDIEELIKIKMKY